MSDMASTGPNPDHGGEQLQSDREWLGSMLSFQDAPDKPGEKAYGWVGRGAEQIALLAPRAQAYLDAGGILEYDQLKALEDYTVIAEGILLAMATDKEYKGEDSSHDHNEVVKFRELNKLVKGLRRAAAPSEQD